MAKVTGTNSASVAITAMLAILIMQDLVPLKEKIHVLDEAQASAAEQNTHMHIPLANLASTELPAPPPLPTARVEAAAEPITAPNENIHIAAEQNKANTQDKTPATQKPILTASQITRGYQQLKQIEDGSLPAIDIQWPQNQTTQRQLQEYFTKAGVQMALLDNRNRLWRVSDAPGKTWQPDLKRYSGIIRAVRVQSNSQAATAELMRRIKTKHKVSGVAQLVTVFPRRLDAQLLASIDLANTKENTDFQYRWCGTRPCIAQQSP